MKNRKSFVYIEEEFYQEVQRRGPFLNKSGRKWTPMRAASLNMPDGVVPKVLPIEEDLISKDDELENEEVGIKKSLFDCNEEGIVVDQQMIDPTDYLIDIQSMEMISSMEMVSSMDLCFE